MGWFSTALCPSVSGLGTGLPSGCPIACPAAPAFGRVPDFVPDLSLCAAALHTRGATILVAPSRPVSNNQSESILASRSPPLPASSPSLACILGSRSPCRLTRRNASPEISLPSASCHASP